MLETVLYRLRLFVVGGKHIAIIFLVVGHICTQNIFRHGTPAESILYGINICIVVLPTLNADDTDSLCSLLSSDGWRIKYLGNEVSVVLWCELFYEHHCHMQLETWLCLLLPPL